LNESRLFIFVQKKFGRKKEHKERNYEGGGLRWRVSGNAEGTTPILLSYGK